MRVEQIDFKNKRASRQEVGVHDGFSLITSWSAVTVLFCLTFGITYLGLMWRDGAFDQMFGGKEVVKIEDRSWMLGDKKRYRSQSISHHGNAPERQVSEPEAPSDPGTMADLQTVD